MAIATLFGALGTGVSGLFVSRAATAVINHNIANANTPGYSRQYLAIGTNMPVVSRFGALGRGAQAMGIDRVTDHFVEQNLFRQTSLLGTYATIDDSLRNVEGIMGGVDNDRIGDAMNAFFDSYSELSAAPEDSGRRQNVVRRAEALAFQFRDIAAQLVSERRDVERRIQGEIEGANALLEQVAILNGEIVNTGGGGSANDLVDQRNLLLNQLSGLVTFDTHTRSDGSVDVIVQGRTLVTRDVVQKIQVETEIDPNTQEPRYRVSSGKTGDLDLPLQSGSVAGLLRMGNEILPDLLTDLDNLAVELMERVNALHRDGVTQSGGGFNLFAGSGAADMQVLSGIVDNPDLLATGRSGEPGDNEIADAIAGLRDTLTTGEDQTLNDIYLGLLGTVASERGTFQTLREGQTSVVQGVAARLEEARGVNVDEELTYLLQYQRAYEASARVIRSVDEMLDTLINRMI